MIDMKTNEKSAVTEQKFKHGDKIKCISESDGYLTKGKIYIFDKYHPCTNFTMIAGCYDNNSPVEYGVFGNRFELAVEAAPVKDNRKKYTLVYSEGSYIGCGQIMYVPKLKKIKVKDIAKYLAKADLDVQYVIKGHVTLVE